LYRTALSSLCSRLSTELNCSADSRTKTRDKQTQSHSDGMSSACDVTNIGNVSRKTVNTLALGSLNIRLKMSEILFTSAALQTHTTLTDHSQALVLLLDKSKSKQAGYWESINLRQSYVNCSVVFASGDVSYLAVVKTPSILSCIQILIRITTKI